MTPLQRIAMGVVFLAAPASFRIGGYIWDGLPDPIGWILILTGLRGLRPHLEIESITWVAWIAFAVSIPQWIPPVFEHLVPTSDSVAEYSIKWAFFLPEAAFGVMLARAIGQAGLGRTPRDRYVASRFGVLTWAFALLIALPPIAFGTGDQDLIDTTLLVIGLVPWFFVYYLFRAHWRPWLGGDGPREYPVRSGKDTGRPPSD